MEVQEMKVKLEEGLRNIQQKLNNTNAEIARLQEQSRSIQVELFRQEGAIMAVNQLISEPELEEDVPELEIELEPDIPNEDN